jgi:endonuclease VIII
VPEGHTLHRLAKRHQKLFARRPVRVSSPQGRFAAAAALLDGRVLTRVEAHGKHLFHTFSRDEIVHVHLGLYGTFDDGESPAPPPRGQLRLRLEGETHWADLRGPTACDLITRAEARAIRDRLGPDPLRRDFDAERAWARIGRSSSPIATLLMDQKVVAGVGNVYRAELLFRHGLDPQTSGKNLDKGTWDAMAADLVTLMKDGVRTGRIDTVRPEDDPRRKGHAARKDRHGGEVYVYRRAGMPCHVCGTEVRTVTHQARNLFWCPTCQP